MRILLVSDIHANLAALEAIREPFDLCLCLGDVVEYGPDNAECIDWVRRNAAYCVRGNHDHGAAQNVEVNGVGGFRYLTGVTRRLAVADLSEPDRRFLAGLPTLKKLVLDGRRYLLCHASPRDPLDEYVPCDAASWGARTAGLGSDTVCVGHTHAQFVLDAGGVTVINPGSVGLQRDGDPRAKYAIIDNGQIFLRQAEYDVESVVERTLRLPLEERAKQMMVEVYRHGRLLAPQRPAAPVLVERAG